MPRPSSTKFDDAPPIVRLEGISKSFGPVKANHDIHLNIQPGKVLALLGENGAGKSTLMNMLSGVFAPDSGNILIDGQATKFATPKAAIDAGIGMVYQHFTLVNTMTVAQNVLLGQEGSYFVNPREMEARVEKVAHDYGLDIDPRAKVSDLSMGERQRVEILKLLYRDSRVLILDEPTAVLTPKETGQLFEALWAMTTRGKAIVFISHKLEEVIAVADTVSILRQGSIVDTMCQNDIKSKEDLANRMVGREVMLEIERTAAPRGGPILEIDNLSGNGLDRISLTVHKGEVMAIVGVAGNGQKALVETVVGQMAPQSGRVTIQDQSWKDFYSSPSWNKSIAYIPEDRLGIATCPNLDLVDNVLLTTRRGFAPGLFLEKQKAVAATKGIIRRYHVATRDTDVQARQLSGGNLQKLVLGREFFRKPRLIVAEQPSQGLDVAATEEVWHRLLNARQRSAVLLVTGDLNEALQLADRVAVMFRGRIMDIIDTHNEAQVKTIGLLMAGIKR